MQFKKKFLPLYYTYAFFSDFIFAYVIYNVIFEVKGLSLFQISQLFVFWIISIMIFEIPSGVLADRWDRRKMLILSPLMKSMCFLLWYFAEGNFYIYALGFVFWGASIAFTSGTKEAFLYDYLINIKKRHLYEKILSREYSLIHIALLPANIIGGVIAHYNMDLTLILSSAVLIIPAVCAYLMNNRKPKKKLKEISHIKSAFKEILNNKTVLFLAVNYLFFFEILGTLEEYNKNYFHYIDLPIFWYGIVFCFMDIFNSLGSYIAVYFKNKNYAWFLLPFISGVSVLLIGIFPSYYSLGLLVLAYFCVSPLKVLARARLQHSIEDDSRSTITSMSNFVVGILALMINLLFGFLSTKFNIQAGYIAFGTLMIFMTSYRLLTNKK
jgi:MFS family permease